MKRIATLGLCVFCLLFVLARESGIAGKAVPEAAQEKSKGAVWKPLANGAQLLPVYETPGSPAWPQIAVLRLPEAEFKKFEADAKEYVNALKVFPVPANSVSIGRVMCPPKKGGDYVLVLLHCPDSTVTGVCGGAK